MRYIIPFFIVCILCMASTCKYSSKYKNDPFDVFMAERLGLIFYDKYNELETEELAKVFKFGSYDEMIDVFDQSKKILGRFEYGKYSLVYTERGLTNGEKYLQLRVQLETVRYEFGETSEILNFILKNGQIQLMGYELTIKYETLKTPISIDSSQQLEESE